jgi:hypothetical protein
MEEVLWSFQRIVHLSLFGEAERERRVRVQIFLGFVFRHPFRRIRFKCIVDRLLLGTGSMPVRLLFQGAQADSLSLEMGGRWTTIIEV